MCSKHVAPVVAETTGSPDGFWLYNTQLCCSHCGKIIMSFLKTRKYKLVHHGEYRFLL